MNMVSSDNLDIIVNLTVHTERRTKYWRKVLVENLQCRKEILCNDISNELFQFLIMVIDIMSSLL